MAPANNQLAQFSHVSLGRSKPPAAAREKRKRDSINHIETLMTRLSVDDPQKSREDLTLPRSAIPSFGSFKESSDLSEPPELPPPSPEDPTPSQRAMGFQLALQEEGTAESSELSDPLDLPLPPYTEPAPTNPPTLSPAPRRSTRIPVPSRKIREEMQGEPLNDRNEAPPHKRRKRNDTQTGSSNVGEQLCITPLPKKTRVPRTGKTRLEKACAGYTPPPVRPPKTLTPETILWECV
jgi:hypothetical protein